MLNIGRLAPGAADYYVGEVATSAEDYYTGKGESRGRWVGSLCPQLGLQGTVRAEDFRAVLDGRDPRNGERLVRSRAGRIRGRCGTDPNQECLFDDEMDITRTASRLRVTVGRVRQLAWAGDEARRGHKPTRFLVGRKALRRDGRLPVWVFRKSEVERYEAEHGARKARPGYDLTLRPPKSVSILWALGSASQRAAIRKAHREAVDVVVSHIETHALYAKRGSKDRGRVEVDGLVAAAFDHRTSRAGDPLLHTHVVAANLTHTADDKWQAVDGRPLFDNARPAGHLYQAHLRHLLSTRLGIEWEPVHNGWAEITGVPEPVIRAFSKRRDEIEEMVAESGYTSARAHQAATLETRQAKEYGVDPARLEERWRSEAAALGFDEAQIALCFARAPELTEVDDSQLFADLAGPEGLTQHASTFSRRNVVAAISERVGARSTASEIESLVDGFLSSEFVTPLAPNGDRSERVWRRDGSRSRSADLVEFSTPDLLRLERRLLDQATHGFGSATPAATPLAIDAAVKARPELSDEQITMVRALCASDSPAIQAVAGRPGAGKTHATAAAVEALVGSDVPVFGCSLSAAAAAELESATQLGPLTGHESSTVARLLIDLSRHPLPSGAVVIVDEASMVGTRDIARLADHVERASGALKLIGDPDQHGAVETGGLFRLLCEVRGDTVVRLSENNRQARLSDRTAINHYREGRVEAALARYDVDGSVVRSATASASYEAVVTDWWEGARTGSRDPMIAGPNSVRRALNERARRRLRDEGVLQGDALETAHHSFQVGDWIVARRNARGLRSTNGHWVKNGSAGVIEVLDHQRRTMTVAFEREGRILLPATYIDGGFVDHGYARTTYGVQGATLDRALYHAGDEASFEEGYVALTRGRYETRIYLVDGIAEARQPDDSHRGHDLGSTGLSTVAEALERRRAKSLAHEADQRAADVHSAFDGWSLRDLHAERSRLEHFLSTAPRDVSKATTEIERQRDRLLTQQRTLKSDGSPLADRATESLRRCDMRRQQLTERSRARDEWLDRHRDEVDRLRLVLRAEHARELTVRVDALHSVPSELWDRVGRAPTDLAARQAWEHALGEAAVHLERFGALDNGPGPAEERWSRARVENALDTFDSAARLPAHDEGVGLEL